MISDTQALRLIRKNVPLMKSERCHFLDALGHVLSQDLKATCDLPTFNRSTMDGYALRFIDSQKVSSQRPICLKIVDRMTAGRVSRRRLGCNETVRITTGSMIPQGADAVVKQEDVVEEDGAICLLKKMTKGENIAHRAEDIKKNETVLTKGHIITPAVISLCAAMDIVYLSAFKRPQIAIIATGDELIDTREPLRPGKVRSCNQYALLSQLRSCGFEAILLGIARDNRRDLKRKIACGLRYNVLLISGGVSVGPRDLVGSLLQELGARKIFWKVAVKPGKPLLFARKKSTVIFGLPGNPVSTMISFIKFVQPALLKMSGALSYRLPQEKAVLDHDLLVEPGRKKIIRGYVYEGRSGKKRVTTRGHQGSGNLVSLVRSNCFFEIPQSVKKVRKGQRVAVTYPSSMIQ